MNIYCGLDEVGTGCLAGPIVSVAVQMEMVLDAWPMPEVKDSKKTTALQRARSVESILKFIHSQGGIVGVGESSVEEINSLGHTAALQLSYKRAVREATLFERPKLLLVDGDFGVDGYAGPQRIAPKMDANNFLCAAASIIAKVARDTFMTELDVLVPVREAEPEPVPEAEAVPDTELEGVPVEEEDPEPVPEAEAVPDTELEGVSVPEAEAVLDTELEGVPDDEEELEGVAAAVRVEVPVLDGMSISAAPMLKAVAMSAGLMLV